jgi:hypothetical protein
MPGHFILLILLLSFQFSMAQNHPVRGTVRETFTQTPLPFVHIIVNGGETELLSDLDGNFQVSSDFAVKTLLFKHHLHRNTAYTLLSSDTLPLNINMNKYLPFFYESETNSGSSSLIEKVMLNRNENRIENLKPFSYFTYNKYTLGTENIDQARNSLKKKSGKLRFGLQDFKDKQHFFLLETVTERRYYNAIKQKETVIGAKAS